MCCSLLRMQTLTLSRDQFTSLLGGLGQLRTVWRLEALRRVPLFSGLSQDVLNRLASVLQPVYLKAGQNAITQVSPEGSSKVASRLEGGA